MSSAHYNQGVSQGWVVILQLNLEKIHFHAHVVVDSIQFLVAVD
jgi:hypothetical protein